MKSKKLLIAVAVIVVVISVVVVMASVFTVRDVELTYHAFDGSKISNPENGLKPDEISALVKGKSIVFLSKTDFLTTLNDQYIGWHAFAVVKNFPNVVEVHLVKRTAVARLSTSEGFIYVDCFGYVMADADNDVIDISSAFDTKDVAKARPGEPIEFQVAENNNRLKCVLNAILATWQCKVEVADIPQILGSIDVFTFDSEGNLIIRPKQGGTIKVNEPEQNLSERLKSAYGVYYNTSLNMQDDNWEIIVPKNGAPRSHSTK